MTNNLPHSLIGLMADPHPGLLAGMLGILKAGSGFVPIDPDYPDDRINYMMDDCRIEILVTEAKHLPKVSAIAANSAFLQHIICLDVVEADVALPEGIALHDWSDTVAEVSGPPLPEVEPDQLAYVIYTSGSTGTPKGVPITHRNLSPLLHWSREYFNFGEHTTVLQNLNYCFDFGVFELLTTILFGGTLHFLDRNELSNFAEYADYINSQGINTFHSTPSFLRGILPFCERLECLELLHLGGEALTENILQEIFDKVGDNCILYNGYGPTEATVNCAIFKVGNKEVWQSQRFTNVPIGQASANNFLYVLDQRGQPVPAYVPGELYVGGVALSQGYLNRPDLTAEKFIPNPFSEKPDARLYRTGDLVRYFPDGNIEFLGRIDYQVKVRGFRIELGEIEAVLKEHPGVQEALVLAHEDGASGKRLVAYVVLKATRTPYIGELRSFLQERLPDYMVPSAFVSLDTFPLNSNGKVDRKALPIPDKVRPALESSFVAPRTPMEQTLASIWMATLGLERVGVYDNFFELGGDSMGIIQVVAKANQAGLELKPAQMFQKPTVAALAESVSEAPTVRAQQTVVTGPVPLTPIQHWFFAQQFVNPHQWNWAFLRKVPQPLDLRLLTKTLEHLLRHHDALRLRFRQTNFGWQQVNADVDNLVPFTVIDLSQIAPEAQHAAVELAAAALQTSLNLAEGPLLRLAYFNLGAGRTDRVLIIFHHLVVDVISTRILMEDMQTAMQQLSQGKKVRLPSKTTSFREWSRWLNEYAQTDALKQELDYWLETLDGKIPPLPLDYPGGVNSEASAALHVEVLDAAVTHALLYEIPVATGVRIQDVLLIALTRTFTSWTGQSALLVEMEGHGREHILDDVDVSRTVGWFTSIYPVKLDLSQATNPREALQTIRLQMEQVPNRGIGYGLLRYLCEDESIRKRLQALPEAEVNFNYLGQLDQQLTEATPFLMAPESKGPERSLRSKRSRPLYIVGSVRAGVLRMHWNYSRNLHKQTTIERLARTFNEELRHLSAYHVYELVEV